MEADEEGIVRQYPAAVMTELEAAMWRDRPQDAARIDASLSGAVRLIQLTADEL